MRVVRMPEGFNRRATVLSPPSIVGFVAAISSISSCPQANEAPQFTSSDRCHASEMTPKNVIKGVVAVIPSRRHQRIFDNADTCPARVAERQMSRGSSSVRLQQTEQRRTAAGVANRIGGASASSSYRRECGKEAPADFVRSPEVSRAR